MKPWYALCTGYVILDMRAAIDMNKPLAATTFFDPQTMIEEREEYGRVLRRVLTREEATRKGYVFPGEVKLHTTCPCGITRADCTYHR